MKNLNAIVAYHMIEMAKTILRGEAEAGSVQRRGYAATGEHNMIEIKNDGTMDVTAPATMQEIEKALANDSNQRVELVKLQLLAERLKHLEADAEKARIQKLEREIPTNAA